MKELQTPDPKDCRVVLQELVAGFHIINLPYLLPPSLPYTIQPSTPCPSPSPPLQAKRWEFSFRLARGASAAAERLDALTASVAAAASAQRWRWALQRMAAGGDAVTAVCLEAGVLGGRGKSEGKGLQLVWII